MKNILKFTLYYHPRNADEIFSTAWNHDHGKVTSGAPRNESEDPSEPLSMTPEQFSLKTSVIKITHGGFAKSICGNSLIIFACYFMPHLTAINVIKQYCTAI